MGMQKSAICHQILRNLLKAVYILIPCFLTNFLITESILSLRNTEILCVAIVFNSDDWLKSFNKNKHPLKMKLNTFYFVDCLFVVLRILCVKMKTFLCEESVLHHNKRNCAPSYQGHYLNLIFSFFLLVACRAQAS